MLNITIFHHIIFWTVYFILNTLRWGSYFNDYLYALKSTLLGFPIHMTLCYLHVYFLMPKLLFKRKYLYYCLGLISALIAMLFVKFNLTYFLISQNVWPEGPEFTSQLSLNYSIEMMIGELYVITFVTAIKITIDWNNEHKRVTNLEKDQLEAELLFLKTQISPHFFFNTLNNIYSLSLDASKKAPNSILKLSDLMRYLLHETKKKRQSLKKEIECIQNYLELERMRFDDRLELVLNVTGSTNNKKIAPILLLSFIENAFKHGANRNIGHIKIEINFNIIGDYLHFNISNPLPTEISFEQCFNTKSGIGLKNVKKRLALGYGKDEYDLSIKENSSIFVIDLKIKVS
jgi:two-component system sensor histidine kinase AlgZ